MLFMQMKQDSHVCFLNTLFACLIILLLELNKYLVLKNRSETVRQAESYAFMKMIWFHRKDIGLKSEGLGTGYGSVTIN